MGDGFQGKVSPLQARLCSEGGYSYSSILMTTALEGGEGSAARPGRNLPPVKTGYPLY